MLTKAACIITLQASSVLCGHKCTVVLTGSTGSSGASAADILLQEICDYKKQEDINTKILNELDAIFQDLQETQGD